MIQWRKIEKKDRYERKYKKCNKFRDIKTHTKTYAEGSRKKQAREALNINKENNECGKNLGKYQ